MRQGCCRSHCSGAVSWEKLCGRKPGWSWCCCLGAGAWEKAVASWSLPSTWPGGGGGARHQ
eukprot:6447687-Lingulodinium_polyedra.AAC.1